MELKQQVKEVLIEARMVLPGAQALLGFQFLAILGPRFDLLPGALKQVHLVGLLAIAICTVLLIAPAAYHRIVNEGEDSPEFLRFAGRIVLAAMVPLAIGLVMDWVVVTWIVTQSYAIAAGSGALLFALLMGFWFGYMNWRRSRRSDT